MTDVKRDQGTRVLVPLDGSSLAEQAIPYASALVGEGGTLLFLQVAPGSEPVYGFMGNVEASSEEVAEMYSGAAQEELVATQERWKDRTPATETLVVTGDPADEILRIAAERECSMIVMASHGRGALGRWTYGSVADRVSRTATIPVMIIRPQDATAELAVPVIRRIVVPLDGSTLALQALPVAEQLARRLGISILLIRVINPAQALAPYPSMMASFPPEIYEEIEADMRSEAVKSLAAAAKPLQDHGIEVHSGVVSGSATHSIEDATEQGDIIIMTSHGRSGISRWVLGSVAEQLVRHSPVPVILVRTGDD